MVGREHLDCLHCEAVTCMRWLPWVPKILLGQGHLACSRTVSISSISGNPNTRLPSLSFGFASIRALASATSALENHLRLFQCWLILILHMQINLASSSSTGHGSGVWPGKAWNNIWIFSDPNIRFKRLGEVDCRPVHGNRS